MELTQDLSESAAEPVVVASADTSGNEAGAQEEVLPAQEARIEVASAVAAATTTAAQPSTETAEALRLFRSSLLEMVGAPALYADNSGTGSAESRGGWLRRSPTEDLSCASLIAKYVSLWSVLEKPENQRFSVQALIGLRMLEEQNFVASSKVFREIEFQTSTQAALSYVMKGIGSFILGFVALVTLVALVVISVATFMPPDQKLLLTRGLPPLDKQWVYVAEAGVAGAFGGVVSLLLRISEFESTRGRSQMFLRLTGATLPIVGGLFGAFVASLFCARIINVNIGEGNLGAWAFIVIGFLSGFSERFSRSFIRLAEKGLGGADPATHVSVAANATVSEAEPGARARQRARTGRRKPRRTSV